MSCFCIGICAPRRVTVTLGRVISMDVLSRAERDKYAQ